jgi:hypothetical protein
MREKASALNDIILAAIRDQPGQSVTKTIDTVLANIPQGIPTVSRATITRRILELGARGYLYLREETIVHPREAKKEKKVGNGDPASLEEGSL